VIIDEKIRLWPLGHFFWPNLYIYLKFFITLNNKKKWVSGQNSAAGLENPLFKGFFALQVVATFTFKSGQMARKSGQKV
jgi:hypothetical protein